MKVWFVCRFALFASTKKMPTDFPNEMDRPWARTGLEVQNGKLAVTYSLRAQKNSCVRLKDRIESSTRCHADRRIETAVTFTSYDCNNIMKNSDPGRELLSLANQRIASFSPNQRNVITSISIVFPDPYSSILSNFFWCPGPRNVALNDVFSVQRSVVYQD